MKIPLRGVRDEINDPSIVPIFIRLTSWRTRDDSRGLAFAKIWEKEGTRIIERLAWFTGAGRCTCSGLTAPKENATWSIIYLGEIIPDRASRRLLLHLRNSTLLRSSDETNNSPWIFSKDPRISARAIGEENLNRRDPQFSNKSPINFFFGDGWREGRGWKTQFQVFWWAAQCGLSSQVFTASQDLSISPKI